MPPSPSTNEVPRGLRLSSSDIIGVAVPQLDSADSLHQIDLEDQETFIWDTTKVIRHGFLYPFVAFLTFEYLVIAISRYSNISYSNIKLKHQHVDYDALGPGPGPLLTVRCYGAMED